MAKEPGLLHSCSKEQLRLAGGLLVDLVARPPFNKSISLWLTCYEVCRHLEGELSKETLEAYYEEAAGISNRMPCRALMVLAKAHMVIGEAEKCHRKGVSSDYICTPFSNNSSRNRVDFCEHTLMSYTECSARTSS